MSFSIDLFTGGVCRRTGSAIAAAFCIGTAGVNAQNIADELSPTQRQELQKGAPVCIQEEVPGIAWPRSTVFQKIAGVQPEEVIAVFFRLSRRENLHSKCADFQDHEKPCRVEAGGLL